MLKKLNDKNDVRIYTVTGDEFLSFGRIVTGYDVSGICRYLEEKTQIPEQGNVYLPSVEEMEHDPVYEQMKHGLYGGMDIQIGYCNGKNTTYNGFEYHKGSEINIAVTDFMLVLGHSWDICNNTYKIEDAMVFFVEKGTVLELYQTTLHLSPCRVSDDGFKDVVVLPKGTNTPFVHAKEIHEAEGELLLLTNKWVIAHPEREALIRQGAYSGILGVNKELYY